MFSKNDIYLNNDFMLYLLQLHINPFSEWHFGGGIRVLCTLFLVHVNPHMKHQALFSSKDKSINNKSVVCCNFSLAL